MLLWCIYKYSKPSYKRFYYKFNDLYFNSIWIKFNTRNI